jgi:hypothetical protein
MTTPPLITRRLQEYCDRRSITTTHTLGQGKDGAVWRTDRDSAIKIHVHQESYQPEIIAYIRLLDRNLTSVAGFQVPQLLDFDDELRAIEMTIVFPPYLLDFASAIIDRAPDLIEDDGNTLADLVAERFGERAAEVLFLQQQLVDLAGIYITDLHPHNIKFAPTAA